jgi:hypothetical protein
MVKIFLDFVLTENRGTLAKVVSQIFGSFPDAFHVRGESLKGTLAGRRVFSSMIELLKPDVEGLIELMKGVPLEAWQEIGAHGAEETLDFPFSLGLVWPCVYQRNTETCGDVIEMMGAKGRSVIGVELSGEPSGQQGRLKSLHVTVQGLGEEKLCMRYEPGVIVDEGQEVGLAPFVLMFHRRSVHAVGLP